MTLLLAAVNAQAQHVILHNLGSSAGEGMNPRGSLTLSGTNLYGLTSADGSHLVGVVFPMKAAGSDYTNLHHFSCGANGGIRKYAAAACEVRGPNGRG